MIKRVLRSNNSTIRITVQDNNQELNMPTVIMANVDKTRFRNWRYWESAYRITDDNIDYINLGKIQGINVDEMMAELESTKGLVIDIRNYPTQFIVYSLGKYFYKKPTEFVLFSNYTNQTPGDFEWGDMYSITPSESHYYAGKIIILVNEITQSQSEFTTMAFKRSPNVKVLGSQTSGADGNVSYIDLPFDMKLRFTGVGVYDPDKGETQRVGMQPDILLKPTLVGVKLGKDELLEKAIKLIKET